jgi:hypothetical protein
MVTLFEEADGYFLIDILLLFILIAFNEKLGLIYISMVAIDWALYYFIMDRNQYNMIPIEQNKSNRLTSVITSIGLFLVFYFVVAAISMKFTTGTAAITSDSFSRLGQVIAQTFSATPILYGSNYLKLVVWGILIPIVETRFFFRTLMQWGTLRFAKVKIPDSVFSLVSVWIAGFWGAVFMIFHIMAKDIKDNQALFITFLFGFFSVMCVIYFREVIQAKILHILWNSIGTMFSLNIGFAVSIEAGLIMSATLILVAWAMMFQQIPFITKNGMGVKW